jgi:PAS domain S-box-containing protein
MEFDSDRSARARPADEESQHLWFLACLDRINRAMQGTNDLEKVVSDVLDAVLEIFGCDRAWLVYPCDADAPTWRLVMQRARAEFTTIRPGTEVPSTPAVRTMSGIARSNAGAVLFGPGHEHALSAESTTRFQVRAQMMMALYPKGDRPYAFGVHQCSRQRTWTQQERRLFEETGHRLEDGLTSLLMFRSLRESQRRLDEAQRIAHVGYWERDLDLGTIRLSEESGRIFGLQHDDVLDLSEWNERWLTLIHPEDRPRTAAAAEAAIRGSGQYDVEYRVVRADGSVRFVHSRGVVIRDASEKPVRMFGMMQDITELRQVESELLAAETRFRTFVDHATDALFVHDDSGRVLDVNREACESLGYQRAELLGLTPALFDWQAGADPGFALRIRSRLDAGESFDFESTHRRKDGSLFPVEVRTRPFWHGGRRFALSLSRDITERKRAEQEREHIRRLEHEREAAIVSERARLAGEIHDTLAQGLAMIVMQLADAEAKLGPLWSRAEKPLNTVRELAVESLAYARRSLNMLRPSVTAGGLPRAIRDVADSLRRHYAGEVVVHVKGDPVLLPAAVESALAGIAREALSNAIRHSGASRVSIEIEFSDSGAARLIVADEGIGFDTNAVRPDGYGLICMNERAMRAAIALTFVTEPGAGTEIVASWTPAQTSGR